MPAKKPPKSRSALYVAGVVLLGLCLFLILDRDSFVHGMIYGDEPFSWVNVWNSLADYGYLLFTLYILFTAAVLFLENRNPDSTIAWLLVLALLPVVGFILYWLVGPNFRYLADKRRFRLPKPRAAPNPELNIADFSPMMRDTAQLMYRTAGARLVTAADPLLLHDGAAAFARIKDRLRAAKRYILLETYILRDDRLGGEIRDILTERAKAGVFVCVLYDAVGSWKMGKAYIAALRESGVKAFAFLPVAFPMFRGANYRNHRKIIVVDGDTAYMGGMNIGDEYAGYSTKFTDWRDAHLEMGGQAADVLRDIFTSDLAACARDDDLVARVRSLPVRDAPGPDGPASVVPAQIIASGPDTPWDTIHKAYLSVISRTRKTLWLTTPYLVPGDTLMEAICMASLSGVDVRLLLPARADHILVHWASMNCLDELLRSGVRIFLYDVKGFVHAKTIVSDGELLSIGSANLDTRSLRINFEAQAFLYGKTLAFEAERVFTRDMARSREVTFMAWRRRSILAKVKESVGKIFSSLL